MVLVQQRQKIAKERIRVFNFNGQTKITPCPSMSHKIEMKGPAQEGHVTRSIFATCVVTTTSIEPQGKLNARYTCVTESSLLNLVQLRSAAPVM